MILGAIIGVITWHIFEKIGDALSAPPTDREIEEMTK